MNKKKQPRPTLSQAENEQVQSMLTQYHQIATQLHECTESQGVEASLTQINNMAVDAQIALLKALASEQNNDAANVLAAIHAFGTLKEARNYTWIGASSLRLAGIRFADFWQQEKSMQEIEPGSSHPSNALRDLLGEMETLRIRRQEEVSDRPHPRLKRFTQQELNDEACPTYKNLLVGRSRRVPSRATIIQMAQYLECTAQERNILLLASRYLPESLELEGFQLKQALEQAQQTITMFG